MTTANTTAAAPPSPGHFEFPDPPEREPDDMTSFDHLSTTGNVHHLIQHLGSPATTLVAGERYLSLAPTRDMTGLRYPDLLVAFEVDPAAYHRSNAYVISEQGKPPDFVLEIASRRTGREDVTNKRDDYAALGILEYWRFDETGRYHGARLAGDRLVEGRYETIGVTELDDAVLQGYSRVLNVNLRWERGELGWHDPATGRHILTYNDLLRSSTTAEARANTAEARANTAEARANTVETRANTAETRANQERAARIQAEAQVRELEEQLRRLRGN